MALHQLNKTTHAAKKRVGRGYGSGRGGHTSGRGSKGERARGKLPLWFEGGQLPLVKRLPFWRGKGRFKPLKPDPLIVNLKYLNLLPAESEVTLKTLVKHNLVREQDARAYGIKILGQGNLGKKLTVRLPTSKSAARTIEKAGGKVVLESATVTKLAQPKQVVKQTSTQRHKAAVKKKPTRVQTSGAQKPLPSLKKKKQV